MDSFIERLGHSSLFMITMTYIIPSVLERICKNGSLMAKVILQQELKPFLHMQKRENPVIFVSVLSYWFKSTRPFHAHHFNVLIYRLLSVSMREDISDVKDRLKFEIALFRISRKYVLNSSVDELTRLNQLESTLNELIKEIEDTSLNLPKYGFPADLEEAVIELGELKNSLNELHINQNLELTLLSIQVGLVLK